MKKLVFILLIACTSVQAQVLHPVKWAYGAKRTGKTEAVVFIKATIDDGWHIYSVDQKPGGPLKTSFEFSPSGDFEIVGNVSEPTPATRFEKVFNMNVNYFEHEVIFQQKVSLRQAQADKALVFVLGSVSFMCCNDHQCLAPETVNFSVPIK